jgi:hypothetical protein
MFAVIREATYAPGDTLVETPQFQTFQDAHAAQPGYRGTVVVALGAGRHVTATLWETAQDMAAAREAIGPVVGQQLEPLMAAPSTLIGTGSVVFTDL